MQVKVKPHQNLLDVTIQETGELGQLFRFAVANNLAITAMLTASSVLTYPDDATVNTKVLMRLKQGGVIPATADTATASEPLPSGIGYMIIETSLIVG